MAASTDSVVTRPWIDLSQHGFRVLHTKDGKNRHMVMLAPLIPDEELQTTRNRLAEYAGSLKSMTGTPEHPVKGTLYKDKYWILTGSGLSTFKGIWSTVKKGFPEARLQQAVPVHFINLPRYLQYTAAQAALKDSQNTKQQVSDTVRPVDLDDAERALISLREDINQVQAALDQQGMVTDARLENRLIELKEKASDLREQALFDFEASLKGLSKGELREIVATLDRRDQETLDIRGPLNSDKLAIAVFAMNTVDADLGQGDTGRGNVQEGDSAKQERAALAIRSAFSQLDGYQMKTWRGLTVELDGVERPVLACKKQMNRNGGHSPLHLIALDTGRLTAGAPESLLARHFKLNVDNSLTEEAVYEPDETLMRYWKEQRLPVPAIPSQEALEDEGEDPELLADHLVELNQGLPPGYEIRQDSPETLGLYRYGRLIPSSLEQRARTLEAADRLFEVAFDQYLGYLKDMPVEVLQSRKRSLLQSLRDPDTNKAAVRLEMKHINDVLNGEQTKPGVVTADNAEADSSASGRRVRVVSNDLIAYALKEIDDELAELAARINDAGALSGDSDTLQYQTDYDQLTLTKQDIQAGQYLSLIENGFNELDAETRSQISQMALTYPELATAISQVTGERNYPAALQLLNIQRTTYADNAPALQKLSNRVRELAAATPVNHATTTLALDTVATRLDIDLEYAPADPAFFIRQQEVVQDGSVFNQENEGGNRGTLTSDNDQHAGGPSHGDNASDFIPSNDDDDRTLLESGDGQPGLDGRQHADPAGSESAGEGNGRTGQYTGPATTAGVAGGVRGSDGSDRRAGNPREQFTGTGNEAGSVNSGSAAADDQAGVRIGGTGSVRDGDVGGSAGGSSEVRDQADPASGASPQDPVQSTAEEAGTAESGDRTAVRAGADTTQSEVGGSGAPGEQPDAGDPEGNPGASDGDGTNDGRTSVPTGEQQPPALNRFTYPQGHDHQGKSRARRVEDNLDAMRLLFELNEQERDATDEEKAVLAEYSGWGSIHPNLFAGYWGGQQQPDYVIRARDQINDWLSKGKLTTTEHRLLTGTILNAHFTHSGVIRPMWEGIAQLGVPRRRVLEPSCGILNFKGHAPEALTHESVFTGVELDPITARIAQAVHSDAKVHTVGFEEAPIADNFFDVAISNVPFGEYPVFDRENPSWNYRIHNYFFLKSLQKLKPGGVTAFVTSAYTMDAQDTDVRQAIMDEAHVIGAFRLPTGTFSANTQTEVMTDIIFLQKKGNFTPNYSPIDIRETGDIEAPLVTASAVEINGRIIQPGETVSALSMNQYFIDHPEHVLGNLGVVTTQHGPALRVLGNNSIPELEAKLSRVIKEALPKNINLPVAEINLDADLDRIRETQKAAKTGGSLDDLIPGAIYFDEDKQAFHTLVVNAYGDKLASDKPVKVAKKNIDRMHKLLSLMDVSRELLILQSEPESPTVENRIVTLREELNQQYDQFVAQYGPVSSEQNEKLYRKDTRAPFLYGLESLDEKTGEATKTAIFERRVVSPTIEPPKQAATASDALAISLAYTGTISLPYMRQLLQTEVFQPTEQDVLDALLDQELVFVNPETDKPETRDEYLSGNLGPKIIAAEKAAASDPAFQRNLDELKAHLPEPLKPSQIKVGMDAFWLPKDVIESFLSEALELDTSGTSGVEVVFDEVNRYWRIQPLKSKSLNQIAREQDHRAHSRWGTERAHVFRLLDNAFTNTVPVIRDKVEDNPPRYEINHAETLKAQGKYEELIDAFNRWIYKDPQRARRLADIYNERFNTWRLVEPDGSHMVYPGMAPNWTPREHQNNFIWRAISGKNSLTAHVVGAGKTMQLIGTAVRGKQLNRWQKPMLVVPNHMLRQFAGDAQTIYPSARILVLDKEDITPSRRAEFVARAAMGDWDLVVCTHSSFSRIGVPTHFEAQMLENELVSLRDALMVEQKANGKGARSPSQRDIERKIKAMEAKLKKMNHAISENKDDVLNLEEMGVDFIGVDEAHYYKNLAVDSARSIPGVSNSESVRAWDMFVKCRYLQDLHNGPYGVMMATGTPISNSVVECYTFTRMMRPDLLKGAGIHNFNDWMSLFGEIRHNMEIKPEGGGYQVKSRLSRFKNLPELVKMIREFIDFKTREDLNLPTPKIHTETVVAPQTELMSNFMKYIEARARVVRNGKNGSSSLAEDIAKVLREGLYGENDKTRLDEHGNVDPDKVEKQLSQDILLSIATDGRKASLDPRLIHPQFPDDPNSKVNLCIAKALELYRKYDDDKAAQLIFCDFSSPTGKGIFNVYDDIKQKLIKQGVPENEIAFIHDAVTDDDKEELFAKVRSGEVRFLLGSTNKMGVGTNVQERLIALHQLDPPWKPADIEQRLGRVDRQGNMFEEAFNFIYTTEDSFDLFMWETLNRKLAMIKQAMRNPEDCEREMDEDVSMGYEDILAVTTGNPKIKEFIDSRLQLDKLKRLESSHLDEQSDLAAKIAHYESRIKSYDARLELMKEEAALVEANRPLHLMIQGPQPGMQDGDTCHIGGLKGLAAALGGQLDLVRPYTTRTIGTFGGLNVVISRMKNVPQLGIMRHDGQTDWLCPLTKETDIEDMLVDAEKEVDPLYKAARKLANTVHKIGTDNGIAGTELNRTNLERSLFAAREDLNKPFDRAEELEAVRQRYQELSEELGDVMAEGAAMNPSPLIDFTKLILNETNAPVNREKIRELLGIEVDSEDEELADGPQMA